jgi:hypothetical protein
VTTTATQTCREDQEVSLKRRKLMKMSKKSPIRYRSDNQRIIYGKSPPTGSHTLTHILLTVQIRASVEDKEGRKFDEFTAVKYCTQVVAGINYFIKVPLLNDF